MKKLRKIAVVFLLVFLLTGCTKQLVVEKTNEKGKKAKIDWNSTYAEADKYLKMVGLSESSKVLIKEIGTGKQQLVEIAKALALNPTILILDEATSALDNTTEIMIQQALDELCKGRTTLVVAHRLSTVKHADEIAVIENGKVIERGTHDDLMKNDGVYKRLYSQQFRED